MLRCAYHEVDEGHPDEEGEPADQEATHDETQAQGSFGFLRPEIFVVIHFLLIRVQTIELLRG